MFNKDKNKDKNKTQQADQVTISVKMHTMKDDMDSFVNTKKVEDFVPREAAKTAPVFVAAPEENIEKDIVVETPEQEMPIKEFQEEDMVAEISEKEILVDEYKDAPIVEEEKNERDLNNKEASPIGEFEDNISAQAYQEAQNLNEEEIVEDIIEDVVGGDLREVVPTEDHKKIEGALESRADLKEGVVEVLANNDKSSPKEEFLVENIIKKEERLQDDFKINEVFKKEKVEKITPVAPTKPTESVAPKVVPPVVNRDFDKVENEDVFRIIRDREKKNKSMGSDSPFLTNRNRNVDNIISKRSETVEVKNSQKEESHNFFPKIETEIHESEAVIKKSKSKGSALNATDEVKDLYEYEGNNTGTWFYLFILFLFLLLGGLGYYLAMIKEKDLSLESIKELWEGEVSSKLNVLVEDESDTPSSKDSNQTNVYSDKINFLVINEDELTKSGIRNIINETFVKMNSYQGDQLEFILVNKENKPIKFEAFINAMEIVLDKNILNNVYDNFSIFLSKKDNLNRMGMVVNIQNKDAVLNSLKSSEANILKNLEPIILGGEISSESKKTFSDGTYRDVQIRYMSLNSKPDLSIDYAILKNYLIFATSKESGRMIIDKILSEKGI